MEPSGICNDAYISGTPGGAWIEIQQHDDDNDNGKHRTQDERQRVVQPKRSRPCVEYQGGACHSSPSKTRDGNCRTWIEDIRQYRLSGGRYATRHGSQNERGIGIGIGIGIVSMSMGGHSPYHRRTLLPARLVGLVQQRLHRLPLRR